MEEPQTAVEEPQTAVEEPSTPVLPAPVLPAPVYRTVDSVIANGIVVAFDAAGAGPPLVMLHGASSIGQDDWGAQVASLGRAFRCIVPDARGHGRTRWDAARGLRYEDLVADLSGFVDGLGLDTFHLAGFSMGGMTALGFAARHPNRVLSLVLVGVSAEREPRTTVLRRIADVARVDAHDPAWAAVLARRHDGDQGEGSWRRLLPAIVGMVEGQPTLRPADLHEIDAPTLVVVGDRDPFVPVDQAWRLSRQLPSGRLFVAPDCGHEVTARRPILFNEACAGFYRSTESVAARRASGVATA